jgi:hypothetical protein
VIRYVHAQPKRAVAARPRPGTNLGGLTARVYVALAIMAALAAIASLLFGGIRTG